MSKVELNYEQRKAAIETAVENFNADNNGFTAKPYTKEITKSGYPSVKAYIADETGSQVMSIKLTDGGYFNVQEIADTVDANTKSAILEAFRLATGESYPASDKFVTVVSLDSLNKKKAPTSVRPSVVASFSRK